MVDLKKIAEGRTAILWIKPDKIKVVATLNARDMNSPETREHISEIAASIEAQGFLQSHPLEVFTEGEEIYVAAGHCRLAAVMSLIERGVAIEAIPCISEARGTSPAQRLLNQITSNTGQRLNLAEEGKVYSRLLAMGYVIARIAKDAGRSEAHIRNALDFNAAPHEAHAFVSAGKVSSTLAAETIRKEGATEGVAKLTAAVKKAEGEGKAKATKRHVEPKPAKPKGAPARDIGSACESLARRIIKLNDPRDMDASECLAALSRIRPEAIAIFAQPVAEAAE